MRVHDCAIPIIDDCHADIVGVEHGHMLLICCSVGNIQVVHI